MLFHKAKQKYYFPKYEHLQYLVFYWLFKYDQNDRKCKRLFTKQNKVILYIS